MVDRTLRDMTYTDGLPSSGYCGKYGRPFATPADAMANPEQATREFYAAFESHRCDEDASNAAHHR